MVRREPASSCPGMIERSPTPSSAIAAERVDELGCRTCGRVPLDDVAGHVVGAVLEPGPVGQELPAGVEEPPGDGGELVGRGPRRQERQAQRHCPVHRRPGAGQPDRRRARGRGSGGQGLVTEQPAEVLQAALEDGGTVVEGDSPRFEVVLPESGRDDEHETAARHAMQRVGLLGEPGRVPQRQDRGRDADAGGGIPPGQPRQFGQALHRTGPACEVGVGEIAVSEPQRVEAALDRDPAQFQRGLACGGER